MDPTSFKEMGQKFADGVGRIDALTRDVGNLERYLKSADPAVPFTMRTAGAATLGRDGSRDLFAEFGRMLKAAIIQRTTGDCPSHLRADLDRLRAGAEQEKAVADFTTATAATAGNVVPTLISREIDRIAALRANLVSRCRVLNVSPGQAINIPSEGVKALGYIQKTQGGALTELEATFGSTTLRPVPYHSWFTVSNELLNFSDVDFGAIMAESMTEGIDTKVEESLLQGEDGGDDPHDGVLVVGGTNDQNNLAASPTEATMCTFLSESVADYAPLLDSGVFLMHPAKYALLIAATVGAASPLLDVTARTFAGRPILLSPSMLIPATYWAALLDPRDIWIASDGLYRLDVDPYGLFTSNESRVRMMRHLDYAVVGPSKISKADHT